MFSKLIPRGLCPEVVHSLVPQMGTEAKYFNSALILKKCSPGFQSNLK